MICHYSIAKNTDFTYSSSYFHALTTLLCAINTNGGNIVISKFYYLLLMLQFMVMSSVHTCTLVFERASIYLRHVFDYSLIVI